MEKERLTSKRIGRRATYGQTWKSQEAFFDVAVTIKAMRALIEMAPELHFQLWSKVDPGTGKLVHGVECVEPLGSTRRDKFESFMKGFWTALK